MKKHWKTMSLCSKTTTTVLTLVVFALICCIGCKSDDKDDPADDDSKKGRLTITLPYSDFVQPRAIGSNNENGSDNDVISIYQFDAAGKYENRYDIKYANATSSNQNTRTYIIDLREGDKGTKSFAIIQAPSANVLPSLNSSQTAEDLAYKTTNPLTGALNGPFIMTNEKSTDGKYSVSVQNVEESAELNINTKRRAARMDIVSDIEGFSVVKVKVTDAVAQSYIGDVDNIPSASTRISYELSASQLQNDGKSFYLYQTSIAPQSTQLEITANYNGANHVIKFPEGMNIDIKANHLYKLIVVDSGVSVIIDEGVWITSNGDENSELEKGIKVVGANFDEDKKSLDLTDCTFPVKVYITSLNIKPTLYPSGANIGSWLKKDFEISSPTSGATITTYTITQSSDINTQFANIQTESGLLKIYNSNSYLYPGANTIGLRIGNIIWAPVNVGQTEIGTWQSDEKSAWNNGMKAWSESPTKINSWPNDEICPTGWRLPTAGELSAIANWSMGWDWRDGMVNFPGVSTSGDAIWTAVYHSGSRIMQNEFVYIGAYNASGSNNNAKYPTIYRKKDYPGDSSNPGEWTVYDKNRSVSIRCVKDIN